MLILEKEKTFKINDISFHLMKPENDQKIKCKVSRREEIIEIRTETTGKLMKQ